MQHDVEGEVTFYTQAHLDGFEKYNDKFCFLLLSNNNNLPKRVSISKVCFENNYPVLKRAVNNQSFDISMQGRIKQRKEKFFFNVVGTIELVPTPEFSEKEMNEEIDRFFSGVREMEQE